MPAATFFSEGRFKEHTHALDALYALVKAQHTELGQQTSVVRPARLPHPFVTAPVRGDDLLAAHLVLWSAMSMAAGIAGALNADSRVRMEDDDSLSPVRAIFGGGYDATSFVSRDMLIARLEFIHARLS
jgi:hypothetical protein